jgi:zinc transporter, ZIP family
VSFGETIALGALAGFTIYLGLPLARLQLLNTRMRVALAMFSVGVLAFLFVDVVAAGLNILEESVEGFKDDETSLGHALGLLVLMAGGFFLGSAGLAIVERWIRPANMTLPPAAGGEVGELALSSQQLMAETEAANSRALYTGLTIAGAIGLHNFAEGLAIGVSAKSGAISLATVLIIGFALHNTTEGFGIIGPLGGLRPSWKWIGLAGFIGGAPTFFGSVVGYNVTSEPLELAFYSLAGGAILYVIGEVWQGMRRYGHRELGLYMLSLGFFVAVATEMVVEYASA